MSEISLGLAYFKCFQLTADSAQLFPTQHSLCKPFAVRWRWQEPSSPSSSGLRSEDNLDFWRKRWRSCHLVTVHSLIWPQRVLLTASSYSAAQTSQFAGLTLCLPRHGVWEINLGCSNTPPQVKRYCGSDSTGAFLFFTTKGSTVTRKLKQPRRGLILLTLRTKWSMEPVHSHGSYLCDICFAFLFSSHRRTQNVKAG